MGEARVEVMEVDSGTAVGSVVAAGTHQKRAKRLEKRVH
jgi:hypothetical protein